MGLPGKVVKNLPANAVFARDAGLSPGSGKSLGEGNGNPLHYSCLRNPMEGGNWQATVHGIAKHWTQLSDWAYTQSSRIEPFAVLSCEPFSHTCMWLHLVSKTSFSFAHMANSYSFFKMALQRLCLWKGHPNQLSFGKDRHSVLSISLWHCTFLLIAFWTCLFVYLPLYAVNNLRERLLACSLYLSPSLVCSRDSDVWWAWILKPSLICCVYMVKFPLFSKFFSCKMGCNIVLCSYHCCES